MNEQDSQPVESVATDEDSSLPISFTDASAFSELFGTKARVELIDALLHHPNEELTAEKWGSLAGRSESSVSRHKDVLKKFDIIEETKKVGRTQFYSLNKSTLTRHLREAQLEILSERRTTNDVEQSVNEEYADSSRDRDPIPPTPESKNIAQEFREQIGSGSTDE